MPAEPYPHGDLERFRIYRRRGNGLTCIATAADPQAMGAALVTLFGEGEWEPGDRVGILQKQDGPDKPGVWVVDPWAGDSGLLKTSA